MITSRCRAGRLAWSGRQSESVKLSHSEVARCLAGRWFESAPAHHPSILEPPLNTDNANTVVKGRHRGTEQQEEEKASSPILSAKVQVASGGRTRSPYWTLLLKDRDLERWYHNVCRGSKITADVYLRRLVLLCASRELSPRQLVQQATLANCLPYGSMRPRHNSAAPELRFLYCNGIAVS